MTGLRNEATFITAKNIIGKILAIPAAAIPLSMLDYYGYISPSAIGLVSPQPKEATLFIKTIIVTIPAVLSAVSLFFKLGYPFLYKDQMDLVADGIGLHLLGRISYDPITAERYTRADNSYPAPNHHRADGDGQEEPLLRHRGAAGGGSGGGPRHHEHGAIMANAVNPQPSPSELRKVECMEHFHRVKDARDLLHGMRQENVLLVIAHFIESSRDSAGLSALVGAGALSGIIATWHFFKDSTGRSFVPVLMTVILCVSVLFGAFFTLRLMAALRLKSSRYRPSMALLEKMIRYLPLVFLTPPPLRPLLPLFALFFMS